MFDLLSPTFFDIELLITHLYKNNQKSPLWIFHQFSFGQKGNVPVTLSLELNPSIIGL